MTAGAIESARGRVTDKRIRVHNRFIEQSAQVARGSRS
jgi:hypothetical protein